MRTVVIDRLAVSVVALAGLTLLWRGEGAGLYLLPAGILLSFFAAGAGVWVLLVEINRQVVGTHDCEMMSNRPDTTTTFLRLAATSR